MTTNKRSKNPLDCTLKNPIRLHRNLYPAVLKPSPVRYLRKVSSRHGIRKMEFNREIQWESIDRSHQNPAV